MAVCVGRQLDDDSTSLYAIIDADKLLCIPFKEKVGQSAVIVYHCRHGTAPSNANLESDPNRYAQ